MIIALSGRISSGKTTFSKILVKEFGFERVCIASRLKLLAKEVFSLSDYQIFDTVGKQKLFNKPIEFTVNKLNEIYDIISKIDNFSPKKIRSEYLKQFSKLKAKNTRELLQYLGTEIIRETFGENYHIEYLYKNLEKNKNYVIDDQRFKSEFIYLKNKGAVQIYIIRPYYQKEISNHKSEIDLNRIDFKYVLLSKSLNSFKITCRKFIKYLLKPNRDTNIKRSELEKLLKEKTTSQIAKIYNCSTDKVIWWARMYGLNVPRFTYRIHQDAFLYETPDQMYWVGYLMADASMHPISNHYTMSLGLCFEDKNVVFAFKKFLKTNKKPYTRIHESFGEWHKSITLVVNNPFIIDDIKKYSIIAYRKYRDIEPPVIKDELFFDFLRGYIDGNGTIGGNTFGICNSIVNKKFNYWIVSKLRENGFTVSISNNIKKHAFNVRISKRSDFIKLISLLYKNNRLFLRRKFDKINYIEKDILNKVNNKNILVRNNNKKLLDALYASDYLKIKNSKQGL